MPKTRRLSDATLVRRAQQGDRRAFAALLARYDWRLRGLAHALLLDRGEMDTALGIGYLRAWRDVVRINAKDDVAAWLYRVTYNACIDRLRHLESAGERASTPAHDGIAAGLATLPAAERVPVVLVDREGFTPTAAARILGVSPTALDATLATARDRLAPHVPVPPPAPAEAPPHDAPPADPPGDEASVDDVAVTPAPSGVEAVSGDDHGEPGDESPSDDEVSAADGADADADADGNGNEGGEVETASASDEPGVSVPDDLPVELPGNGHGNGNGSDHIARAIADLPDEDTIVDEAAAVVVPAAGVNGTKANRGRGRRARRRAQHTAAQAPESVDRTGEHDR